MKIRLGTLTGSPETGTGSTGMYWNDRQGMKSGVSFIDYTDGRGKPRRIWPDSDILHIQRIKLDLTPEMARQLAHFEAQRRMLEGSVNMGHSMMLSVNGKVYSMYDVKNTRWDAETNSLLFLRNSGPTPGRIVRGDYATVEMTSREASITRTNGGEALEVLIPNLAPITTCDVTMTAGWRAGANASSTDADRGHVILCDEAGNGLNEAMGQYSSGGKNGKKGGGGRPSFWEGGKTVRGITYNGSIKTRGPVGKCVATVRWPAYQASDTVRVLDVVVG